jgi:predicted transcriptional regulator
MTPRELRATLDRLDLSAAKAGHLLGVHRATVHRWLDGSMSVSIVVELLLRLMVRRGIRIEDVEKIAGRTRHARCAAAAQAEGRVQGGIAKGMGDGTTRHAGRSTRCR